MSEEEKRGFVFHSSQGETELSIEEVKQLAEQNDPDGLYALGMAYLFGWDIDSKNTESKTLISAPSVRIHCSFVDRTVVNSIFY